MKCETYGPTAPDEGSARSVAFIDCTKQNTARQKAWPERPHCEHGDWYKRGDSFWSSPTYSTWDGINSRTRYWKEGYGPDAIYEGVTVEWDSFYEFRAAMGPRPSRDYTIDRIDPEGDYTTENCQWLLAHLNYSKGGRTSARQQSAAMIERMQAELKDLETELLKEGIEIHE